MKKDRENMEELFKRLENQWDFEELPIGHEERFLNKLQQSKQEEQKGGFYGWILAIAAVIVLGVGTYFFWFQNQTEKLENPFEFASIETVEARDYFASVIEQELNVLQSKNNERTQPIIDDALHQMKIFEADYEMILKELQKNGDTKQIFQAMIMNFQARIQFLEDVLNKIEIINQQKNIQNEKTI
ncbi:MAG: anti-sigma factor [Flavobacterium sp.]